MSKKPTVQQALRDNDAHLVVTVDPNKLFSNYRSYMWRYRIAMLLIRVAGWFASVPVITEEKEDEKQ